MNITGGADLCTPLHSPQVTIYDARVSESGGVVARISNAASPAQPLYCQAWCPAQGGLLGVAGAERSVTVLEPRK
jgi:hypothetical protein